MYLSVVVPVYNEEESISSTLSRIADSMKDVEFEILVVNDGSSDKTADIVYDIQKAIPQLKVLELARNSGHMSAITAGIDHAIGRWIVTIDGDGQDPPELIPKMIEYANENCADLCFMVRKDRKMDSFRHRLFSPLFYQMLSRATNGKAPLQAADFRLMSDRVVSVLKQLPETNRVYRVITPDLGFKSVEMEYSRNQREAGVSKYRFIKLTILAIRSLLATSGAPLRWLSSLSITVAGASFFYSFFVLISGIFGGGPPGWASLSLLMSLILFVQSLAMAVICEFLLSIMSDVRRRPLYQIRDGRFGKTGMRDNF
jgi:glycosyltransferase involved in cell wall biosynthesis